MKSDSSRKRIVLVYPYHAARMITPPLGLGYLAGSLLDAGHDVEIIDCMKDKIPNERLGSIMSEKNPDLVGITAMTSFYPAVIETCKIVRTNCTARIIIGGPHPTALPEMTLRETGADAVIMGEGETTITELAGSRDWKKVRGIAYLKGGKLAKTEQRPLANLDELPWPAWELMPPNGYPKAPHGIIFRRFPVAPVMTSRGCPYDCSFCASNCVWHQKFRRRNPDDVVAEIEHLVKKFGVKEIHIEDDNFTLVKGHAMKVCGGIMEKNLDISWTCPNGVRADALDLELLELMKKSGCYLLAFGIESGSEAMLKRHSKEIDRDKIRSAIRMCKRVGMETLGFFILGLPGETKETIEETISFAKETGLDRAHFGIFTPMPGSRLWEETKGTVEKDWKRFNFSEVIYHSPSGLSETDLKDAQKRAFREFYLRPKHLLRMVKYFRPSQLGLLLDKLKKQV